MLGNPLGPLSDANSQRNFLELYVEYHYIQFLQLYCKPEFSPARLDECVLHLKVVPTTRATTSAPAYPDFQP